MSVSELREIALDLDSYGYSENRRYPITVAKRLTEIADEAEAEITRLERLVAYYEDKYSESWNEAPKRVLMTEPHDGHPDTEECPGCPHEE